jgi:arginine deiminase
VTRIQDQVGTLRRVYVRAPREEDGAAWRSYGWHDAPDPARAREEHQAFVRERELAGAEVVLGTAVVGDPESI